MSRTAGLCGVLTPSPQYLSVNARLFFLVPLGIGRSPHVEGPLGRAEERYPDRDADDEAQAFALQSLPLLGRIHIQASFRSGIVVSIAFALALLGFL